MLDGTISLFNKEVEILLKDFIPEKTLDKALEISQKLREKNTDTEYFSAEKLGEIKAALEQIGYYSFDVNLIQDASYSLQAGTEILEIVNNIKQEKQQYFLPNIITNPISRSDKLNAQVLEKYFTYFCDFEALKALHKNESPDTCIDQAIMMTEMLLKNHGFPTPFAQETITDLEERRKRLDFLIEAVITCRKFYENRKQNTQ